MDEEILLKLHTNGLKYFDLPDFETFKLDMADETKLISFKESMSQYYDMPDIETFKTDIKFNGKDIEVDVKEKPTTVTRPISVMTEKSREIDPSNVRSSLFGDDFKLITGEERINQAVKRQDKKVDRIVNDLIGDDVEENVKIKYKTDIKNLPIETINTLADLSKTEKEPTTYDLSQVITYPQIDFPTQSAAAAAMSPSFQGGDQYGQMLDYQKQIDQIQIETLPKPAEVEQVEDVSKPMQKHTKINNLLNNVNDQLDDLLQFDPIGNEDKINELKSQRTSLENLQKITTESINSFANITKTILEEDMSSDKATAITDLLINTDATLYEGLPIRPEANQYLLDTKLPSNLTEYNKFLEWNESLGMLNASGSQINEMANRLNISYEEMLNWVKEYSALMRKKMNAEDVQDLKLEHNAIWLGELGMIATDLNMSKFPKDHFELSELDKVKEEQYNIFVGMNDALELENVPMVVDNLYQNGFFDGEMFFEKTEEEIAPLINAAFNRLGINAYASAGTRIDIAKRIGNNITITSKHGPKLILNTNQYYKSNAANVALELYEYIKKYGEFQSTESLRNLKNNRQVSDFGIQMRDDKFIEHQAIKLNGEADMLLKENNELDNEFNKIATQLTNEYKEAQNQLQNFMINEAEVIDGVVDPNIIKAKQAELFNPIIQKEKEYQEYFKTKREAVALSQDDLKLQKTNYDNAVQASFIMESRKGTFESATVDALLTGTERLVLGGGKLAYDLITYANPLQYISAWSQGKDASDEIDKHLKDFNKSYIEANRGFLSDIGPKPLEQYLRASHEDLLYGAWLGLMESAPAMVLSAVTGGGATGIAAFSLQQVDYLNEEMNNNPYFDDISEAEKWKFIAPLAVATGVLEEVGFAKGILNKGSSNVINTLTFNVLKKLPETATLNTFKKLMNIEVKNSIAKGLIRITKGGGLEYETGAFQALTEVGLKEFYEWSKQDGKVHQQIFETAADQGATAFWNEIQNQAVSEMLGGFYASTPMAIANGMSENRLGRTSTDNQFKFLEFATKGKANMNLIEAGLKQDLANGKITPHQYNQLIQKVKVSASIFREIPKNADLQDRKLAYDLVTEKRKLQDEINIAKEQQNGASVESQIARVKEIDEQLKQISTYASQKGKRQRVNTPVLNNAKNTNLLSNNEIQVINNIQELYASDKYVGTFGKDIRGLDVMENAIAELEAISNNLKESGSNVKENIANDIDKLINFISNKASGTQNYISVDLNKKIKNGKTQQDIEDLYAAYRNVDGYLGQTVYFVNNKPISAREFENLMQDKEFIEQLQNGESNYLILGPSINDVTNYTGEEFLTKDITETRQTKIAEDLEKAEELAEEIAPTVPLQSLETSKEFVDAVTEAGYNLSEDDARNIDALITDEGDIFINKEVAKRTGAVSAPLHEVLHKIIDSEIKDPARKVEIIQEFKDQLAKNPEAYDAVEKRLLEAYGETMTPEQLENSDEWVTAFFDGVARGQIKYNENVFTKIGDWVVNNILRPLGFSKIKFNSGKDVFNFAKSFGKEFKTGKVKKATKEFVKETTAKPTEKVTKKETTKETQPERELVFSKQVSESNKAIADRNTNIEEKIIKAGDVRVRDIKDADLQQQIKDELYENNKKAAEVLAGRAAKSAGAMALDPSKRVSEAEFKSGYDEQLGRLIDTYRPVVDGKRIPFGAYMQRNLKRRYNQILQQAKRGKFEGKEQRIGEVVGEGQREFDIASTDPTPEERLISKESQDKKDRVTPRAKLVRDFPEIFDQELKEDFETAGLEIFESPTPEVEGKEFKGFVTEAFRGKTTAKVKKKLGTGKTYEFNVKKLAAKLKENLPIQWFVRMEGSTPVNEKKFTSPPKRLTKQADIDKAMLDDKVYVEVTSQGVNIYEFKDFTAKELADFILAPLVHPTTGKQSGTRGTRKTGLAEGLVDLFGRQVSPTAIEKVKRKGVKEKLPQISKKLQVDPRTKFSRTEAKKLAKQNQKKDSKRFGGIHDQIRDITGQLPHADPDSIKIFTDAVIDVFAPIFKSDIFSIVNPLTLSPMGNRGTKKIGMEFFINENMPRVPDVDVMSNTETLLANQMLGSIQELRKKIKETGIKDDKSARTLISMFGGEQGLKQYEENLKDLSKRKKATKDIIKKFKKVYDTDNSTLPVIKEFFYNPNASKMWGKNTALTRGVQEGVTLKNRYEEHGYQFGNWAKRTLQAIVSKNPKVLDAWLDWAADNYYQTAFNKDIKVPGLGGIMKTYQGIVDSSYPGWKAQHQEHPVLAKKLDEAIKTGDFSKVPDSEIRFFNEFFTLNPFTLKLDGETYAEKYKLNVPKNLQNNPNVFNKVGELIYELNLTKAGELTGVEAMTIPKAQKILAAEIALASGKTKASRSNIKSLDGSGVVKMSKSLPNSEILREAGIMDKALNIARDPNAPVKKIRVFDFDDTLARTKSNVLYTMPDGKEGKLTAEEFAKRGTEMLEQGAEFDFSEFNKVMEGKKGPLFEVAKKIQDARGTEDVFILTARSMEAAPAIKEFLDSIGLEIPLKNITGLGDSSPLAKSGWIVDKAADGYNDFYFADDAIKNVNAVKKVLDVIDVKSKVQQAKIKFSKNVDKDFNQILEAKTGVDWYKEYSAARAQTMGAGKGKFKFLIPPSAEDFTGLLYRFLGKGKVGDAQMAWFKEHLLNPYARGMNDLSTDRVTMMNDFNALKKELIKSGSIPKNLKKKAIDNFTYEDVARVMAWDKQGIEVADLSKRDMAEFRKFMEDNPGLQVFVDQLIDINKGDGYAYPGKNWLAGSITTDLIEGLNTNKRDKYLQQWRENVDLIFSEKNLNKIEALFGSRYREALEDSLRRMKSGKNRTSTGDRTANRILDYINNSIGTVMFLNMRSGVLQTISAINFLNWGDNNPLKAGIAFANQKQYWSDFMMLMNSDFLVDRRKGLKINVAESEIFEAARNEKNKARAVVNYLLKKGFTVTQIMDSFAIASGGATFYRNRVKSLIKGGMNRTDAEAQAFQDFRETAEESQQSSRPDKISQQQASGAGRIVLAFANTPMQYNRIIKKATLDLLNGRGDYKTNLSKIIYYGMIQNIIFTALQQAIFAIGFDDEEEEANKDKYYKIGDGMINNLLRGLGIGGQVVMTGKNVVQDVYMRYQKSIDPNATWYEKQPHYEESAWKVLDFSPPLSIKLRKLRQAAKNWEYNNWRHDKDPWSLDDPAWLSGAYVISAITNIPLDRLVKKMDNFRGAMEADQDWWKRVALLSGWAEWELESTADRETRKHEEKTERKIFEGKQDPTKWTETEQKDILRQYKVSENMIKKLKTKEQRAQAIEKLRKKTNKTYTPDPVLLSKEYAELAKTNKDEQIKILKDFKVSSSMISRLSTEDKRIKAIIKLRKKYK